MPRSRRFVRAALIFAVVAAARPAAAVPAAEETLRYRWKLDGFVGSLASLFVPSGGEGALSLSRLPNGHLKSELLVTASERAKGDYFRYGSEWQPASGETVRAWSDLVWRGERKSKQAEVDQPGVIDVVSGIQLLRRQPPTAARRMEIWSDGRLYPVLVLPRGTERRRLEGRDVLARHLTVRGLKIPGRKVWQGELELWIADDEAATPLEIAVVRKGARVRLSFLDRGVEASPPADRVGAQTPPSAPIGKPPTKGGIP
jgi:hypothetical protein